MLALIPFIGLPLTVALIGSVLLPGLVLAPATAAAAGAKLADPIGPVMQVILFAVLF